MTQTFGILAVRGAGKSNAAAVMAEGMFAAGLPFVVIDPVGSWYGLRSSADGKAAGLPVAIFGGRHGDVPLEKTGGQLLADLVVDQRLTCVLDLSELSEGDKTRFLIDFAERLYRRNTEPLHLFLEEADDFIPQRPFREQARLVRAWENVVRRGRARGLGMTMITQRSAALNKNVLTQAETLIVLRTTSPQDKKAIAGWIEYHGQSKELLDSLPGLANGEAWVWSPSWLQVLRRVRVLRRSTYDSGATPKAGAHKRTPATLAELDLAAVRARMAETIERARAEDPRELRRQIADLQRQLREKPAAAEPRIERVEVPVLQAGEAASLREALDAIRGVTETLILKLGRCEDALRLATDARQGSRGSAPKPVPQHRNGQKYAKRSQSIPNPISPSTDGDESISGAQQRILDALAELEALGLPSPERVQVALLAGYTNLSSKGFANAIGRLRSLGLIDYPAPGRVVALPVLFLE